jgi:hypothetical protein
MNSLSGKKVTSSGTVTLQMSGHFTHHSYYPRDERRIRKMLVKENIEPSGAELAEMAEKDPYFYKFITEYGSSPPVIGKSITQFLCPYCDGTAIEKLWDREPSYSDHACDANPSYVTGYKCKHCGKEFKQLKRGTTIEEITMPNWRKEVKQNEISDRKNRMQAIKYSIEKKASEVKAEANELHKLKNQLIQLKKEEL